MKSPFKPTFKPITPQAPMAVPKPKPLGITPSIAAKIRLKVNNKVTTK